MSFTTKLSKTQRLFKNTRHIVIFKKKLIKIAMYEYDKERVAEYGSDKSKTWKFVHEITKRKRKSRQSIKNIINSKGEKITKPEEISDCFNEHFSSVGKKYASKFDDMDNLKDPLEYKSKRIENNAGFYDTSSFEILNVIMNQETKKACGYDEISNKIIKKSSDIVAPFLKILFNACLQRGIFPDCFKLAQVSPLFKGGDRTNLGSYRPISLLPAVS